MGTAVLQFADNTGQTGTLDDSLLVLHGARLPRIMVVCSCNQSYLAFFLYSGFFQWRNCYIDSIFIGIDHVSIHTNSKKLLSHFISVVVAMNKCVFCLNLILKKTTKCHTGRWILYLFIDIDQQEILKICLSLCNLGAKILPRFSYHCQI